MTRDASWPRSPYFEQDAQRWPLPYLTHDGCAARSPPLSHDSPARQTAPETRTYEEWIQRGPDDGRSQAYFVPDRHGDLETWRVHRGGQAQALRALLESLTPAQLDRMALDAQAEENVSFEYAVRWARDLRQEAIRITLERTDRIRPDATARGYLYGVMRRIARNWWGKLGERRVLSLDAILDVAPNKTPVTPAQAPGGGLDELIQCERFREAFAALSEDQQEVLRIVDLEGVPQKELGARLGVDPSAVSHRRARALEALRRELLRRG